jgi:hypothetical protein
MLAISKNLCALQFRTQSGRNEKILVEHFVSVFSSLTFEDLEKEHLA